MIHHQIHQYPKKSEEIFCSNKIFPKCTINKLTRSQQLHSQHRTKYFINVINKGKHYYTISIVYTVQNTESDILLHVVGIGTDFDKYHRQNVDNFTEHFDF